MKLAQGTLLEMQLGGGDVMALGQIGDDLLADPTAIVNVGLTLAEAPLQALDTASIGGLAAKIVRVLQVKCVVGAAWSCVSRIDHDGGAIIGDGGLERLIGGDPSSAG